MGDPALEQATMTHLQRQLHVDDVHRHDTHPPGDSHSHSSDHPADNHPHNPSSAWADRIRHGVSEFFGGHSHDAADQIDDALEANAAGRRALGISLIALSVTAVLQAVVVALSGSVALLSDTVHNVADALTAVPLLVAFTLARRPANKHYTYGYGRAEDLAGLFVIAMIALSSVLAAYEAIHRLLHPQQVNHLWAVAGAALIGFLGNELVARYRIRVGRQIGSAALVADGLHARTDGFAVLRVLRSAVRQVGARLMDAVDPTVVDQATTAIRSVEGVRQIRELHIRWIGHTLRAEVDITADATLSITQAHDLAHHAEAHLLANVHRLTAATVHVSPAGVHHA
jgi:divalent metal cation (Fe/Co/Zn/Cd) transporter